MPEAVQEEKRKRVTYNPAAVAKYTKANYDEVKIRVRKGRKAKIKATAKKQGESLNSFVTAAIDERIERLDGSPAVKKADKPKEQSKDVQAKSEQNSETERRISALDRFFAAIDAASDEYVPETFERVNFAREIKL